MSTYSFLLVDFISVIVLFTLLVYSKKDLNLNIDNTINYDLDDEPINEEYSNSDYYNDY